MFDSKVTTKSAWGEMTSINNSCAPGFVPIPCPSHQQYSITNICKAPNCIQPLCPQCIANHVQLHQESKKPAKIQNIITTRTTCIQQLAKMKYEAQKQIQQNMAKCVGNIQQFIQAHEKRLDIAYKKIIKLVDELFEQMNKQMQVIASAYIAEKQKRQKQAKVKLTPLNQFLTSVSQYKRQLETDDYIPALIELLNQPPRKPKLQSISQTQNYGSVQVNEKYLQDIKEDIKKFIKVTVNCKDEGFKGRVQLNKSNFSGSNNMKFSRFDRSKSKQSRINQDRRSNSKRKIFGGQSVVSQIRPGSNSRIQSNNSIYNALQPKQSTKGSSQIQQVRYSNYSTQMKIAKYSYFNNKNSSLWYFKSGSKNAFKATLQEIESGFQKLQLNINFLIPQNHRTIILPNGSVILLGGEGLKNQGVKNNVYLLQEEDLRFNQIQPMFSGRSLFGACYHQDCIYVAGGIFSQGSTWTNKRPINLCQKYNLRQNKWVKISPLPSPSFDFSMHAVPSGRIIKFGGYSDSKVFISKLDIYDINNDSWSVLVADQKLLLTINPGIVQITNESFVVFGGKLPVNNQKISKCYIYQEQQNGSILSVTQGPELYNQATFQSAFISDGTILSIQNNQVNNRNKLIMSYKYDQWKFVSC